MPLSRRRSNETSSTSVEARTVAGREVAPPPVVGDGHDHGVELAARLEAAQEVSVTIGQRMPRRRDRRHLDPLRVRADVAPQSLRPIVGSSWRTPSSRRGPGAPSPDTCSSSAGRQPCSRGEVGPSCRRTGWGSVAVQESDAAGGAPAHVRWYVDRSIAVSARPGMAELRRAVTCLRANVIGRARYVASARTLGSWGVAAAWRGGVDSAPTGVRRSMPRRRSND